LSSRTDGFTVKSHFENKDASVREIYTGLLNSAKKFGPVAEEPKKTSIHLVNKTAFAGGPVHSVRSEMFIDSSLTSSLAPFEGAEEIRRFVTLKYRSAPSNGAVVGVAAGSIDISPLTG
jgi:hypothetical protein